MVTDWLELSAGYDHTCAIRTDSGLLGAWCWGRNDNGQLGVGDTVDRNTPAKVMSNEPWLRIATGRGHTCAVNQTNELFCWGAASFGQLGLGMGVTNDVLMPTGVDVNGDTVQAIGLGKNHTCAITASDQQAYCWGDNGGFQLGIPSNISNAWTPTAMQMQGGFTWAGIDGGDNFTCGHLDTGRVYCVGTNDQHQIGDGATANRSAPSPTGKGQFFAATQLSAGGLHTCAVASLDKKAYCWGSNFFGQIGNGMMGANSGGDYPTEVAGGWSDWVQVAAGGTHSCGLRESGELYCWGNNADGQLGDGSTDASASPVRVGG